MVSPETADGDSARRPRGHADGGNRWTTCDPSDIDPGMDDDAATPTEPMRQGSTLRAFARRAIPIAVLLVQTAAAPPIEARIGYVIDGDTVRLTTGERIRIAGIDAPETQSGQARCAREIVLGRAATARARTMLDGRTVMIERVGRSYHRTVARVRLDGRDLATLLIAAGVARAWPRYAPKPDWCARVS